MPALDIALRPGPIRAEFAAGWAVVAASAAGFGLGLSGLPFYTTGMFVEPLGRSFGWSASQVQAGLTLMLLANMATMPLAARLTERWGARPVALGSILLFGLSFMLLGAANGSLPLFYLNWLLLSAAGAGTLTLVWTRALSQWFTHGRGAALGLAMAGTGVTAMIAPAVANGLIEALGWRLAYVALGALPLIISAPLVWMAFRERTTDTGAAPAAAAEREVSRLTHSPRFWLIGLAFLLVGAAVAGLVPNLGRLLRSAGFTPTDAARFAGLLGMFVLIGRGATGLLLDRFWAPAVAATFFGLAACACVLLQTAPSGALAASAATMAIGFAVGAEFDLLPYLAGRYFGVRRVATSLSYLSIFFYLGAALGPFGFAALSEVTAGFTVPLWIAAAHFALSGAALLFLGPYPADLSPPTRQEAL